MLGTDIGRCMREVDFGSLCSMGTFTAVLHAEPRIVSNVFLWELGDTSEDLLVVCLQIAMRIEC
jgi:hypothetical protein